MKAEFWISWRYFFRSSQAKFVSLNTLISILGVAVGVAALIVVIAVMSGFDNDLKDKIIGANSSILLEKFDGIDNYSSLIPELEAMPEITAASAYINGRAFLYYQDKVIDCMVRGIKPEREIKVTKLGEYLKRGSLALKENGIVIGKELSARLNLSLGERITLFSPTYNRPFSFSVVGIFDSGMYDYDLGLVYIDLNRAQEIFAMPGKAGGIGIKVERLKEAPLVKKKIMGRLGNNFNVRTWQESNRSLFSALKLEKIVMFIILTLIVLVASFNIISTLTVMVTEKTKDIGVLRALGAKRTTIKAIFTLQGILIGICGIISGGSLGIFICYLLKRYQFVKLPQDIYYIERLPVLLQWMDVMVIILAALAISLFSTLYPANRAAKLDPVKALRYE